MKEVPIVWTAGLLYFSALKAAACQKKKKKRLRAMRAGLCQRRVGR